MNWYRNVDREKLQFDFLASHNRQPSYEAEIRQLGGNVHYMSDSEELRVKDLSAIICNTAQFMKVHAHEYDAVHLHTTTFSYPYLYYAKKYGITKRFCHAHSVDLGNTRLSSLRNRLMVLPLRATANHFLACSREAGEKNYYPLGIKDFSVVLNGVDFSRYVMGEDNRQQTREMLGVGEKIRLLCHISNMAPIKNVPFVIQVFAQIAEIDPDSRLLLVGRKELPPEVQRKIQVHGLEDKIIHLGVRTDVPQLLAAADVCLMPSKTEGLGLVAVESQLAGTPVITSPGFPDEVYATELVVRAEPDSRLWAQLAMTQKRKAPDSCRDALKSFDISCIAAQISDYYKTAGDN